MRSLSADRQAPHAGTRDPTHISFLFADDCVAAAPARTRGAVELPTLAERFRRDLRALADAPTPGRPLGVAISGGADSLAMLLLAHAAFPGAIAAATADHGLRAESAGEARLVAAICADIGVPHAILPLAMAAGGGIQARARDARYAALARWATERAVAALATAHHRDDQAETLLMRVARGAGLGGLAAIRARTARDCVAVVRPLLGWSRAELREIVLAAGLTPIADPSNDSLLFDRTRARRLLSATSWLKAERLAATAAHLAEAEEALDWSARRIAVERIAAEPGGAIALDVADLPSDLQRRLVVEALAALGETEPPGPKLARLLATLREGGAGTIGGVVARGDAVWRLSAAPPRRRN